MVLHCKILLNIMFGISHFSSYQHIFQNNFAERGSNYLFQNIDQAISWFKGISDPLVQSPIETFEGKKQYCKTLYFHETKISRIWRFR